MKAPIRIAQDMTGTILCVTGLCVVIIGLSILFDRFSISTFLSLTIGASASILNRYLFLTGVQICKENSSHRRTYIFLIILRFILMSFVSLALLAIPELNPYFGIMAMFFSALSQLVINILRKLH